MDSSLLVIIQAVLAAVVGSVTTIATIRAELKYLRRDVDHLAGRFEKQIARCEAVTIHRAAGIAKD